MNGDDQFKKEPGLNDVPVREPRDLGQFPNEPVPPPPPPEVEVRTMQEDVSSLASTGGLGTQPKTFRPADLLGREEMFKSRNQTGGEQAPVLPPSPKAKPSHALIVSIGAFVFILITAGVVYFFVLPLFKGEVLPPPAPPVAVEPPPPPPEPSAPPPIEHKSSFPITAGLASVPINLFSLSLEELRFQIKQSISTNDPQPTFKELSFTLNDKTLEAEELWNIISPGSGSAELFDRDFTGFVYYDKNGIWPGYIFSLKTDPASMLMREQVSKDSSQVDVTDSYIPNVYLDSPGTPSKTTFSDGLKVGSSTAKYVQYSITGASFNYIEIGDFLIMSTSFNGFKEAIKFLGI